ncbi:hypothetical protein DAI22_08g203100 [Oryza sativa Japonica Group]|nr:hypothetical protein DAI22_08g203100 [Oryza sativa Japonica Group]
MREQGRRRTRGSGGRGPPRQGGVRGRPWEAAGHVAAPVATSGQRSAVCGGKKKRTAMPRAGRARARWRQGELEPTAPRGRGCRQRTRGGQRRSCGAKRAAAGAGGGIGELGARGGRCRRLRPRGGCPCVLTSDMVARRNRGSGGAHGVRWRWHARPQRRGEDGGSVAQE